KANVNKSIRLHDIEGIVLIDEVDSHLHADLQYKVLPQLFRQFPKVQFIVTSHAPLFILGMEELFTSDGIQIVAMPTGRSITTERFAEFQRSFEYFKQTAAFEESVQTRIAATKKPLVLTGGQTDTQYILTALQLLAHSELIDELEIQDVGTPGKAGTK